MISKRQTFQSYILKDGTILNLDELAYSEAINLQDILSGDSVPIQEISLKIKDTLKRIHDICKIDEETTSTEYASDSDIICL